jgi:hypothetical protein
VPACPFLLLLVRVGFGCLQQLHLGFSFGNFGLEDFQRQFCRDKEKKEKDAVNTKRTRAKTSKKARFRAERTDAIQRVCHSSERDGKNGWSTNFEIKFDLNLNLNFISSLYSQNTKMYSSNCWSGTWNGMRTSFRPRCLMMMFFITSLSRISKNFW